MSFEMNRPGIHREDRKPDQRPSLLTHAYFFITIGIPAGLMFLWVFSAYNFIFAVKAFIFCAGLFTGYASGIVAWKIVERGRGGRDNDTGK
jgi:hypothetical protein